MQVFIELENECENYTVDPALTIDQLKNLIEDKTFIPSQIQRLFFNSIILQTGTLEDNSITQGSTIKMVFSVCGGCGDSSRYKKQDNN